MEGQCDGGAPPQQPPTNALVGVEKEHSAAAAGFLPSPVEELMDATMGRKEEESYLMKEAANTVVAGGRPTDGGDAG